MSLFLATGWVCRHYCGLVSTAHILSLVGSRPARADNCDDRQECYRNAQLPPYRKSSRLSPMRMPRDPTQCMIIWCDTGGSTTEERNNEPRNALPACELELERAQSAPRPLCDNPHPTGESRQFSNPASRQRSSNETIFSA